MVMSVIESSLTHGDELCKDEMSWTDVQQQRLCLATTTREGNARSWSCVDDVSTSRYQASALKIFECQRVQSLDFGACGLFSLALLGGWLS